jgi:hypothetical protein
MFYNLPAEEIKQSSYYEDSFIILLCRKCNVKTVYFVQGLLGYHEFFQTVNDNLYSISYAPGLNFVYIRQYPPNSLPCCENDKAKIIYSIQNVTSTITPQNALQKLKTFLIFS